MRRKLLVWLGLGLATLLALACQGSGTDTTSGQAVASTPTPTATPSPVTTTVGVTDEEREFRDLAVRVMSSMGEMTRIISPIGIDLADAPETASLARATVLAIRGSFELAMADLQRVEPPAAYGQLHQTLLDALDFYTRASAALLPDPQTGDADYALFQELMLQGGENLHAAGTQLSDLAGPSS